MYLENQCMNLALFHRSHLKCIQNMLAICPYSSRQNRKIFRPILVSFSGKKKKKEDREQIIESILT